MRKGVVRETDEFYVIWILCILLLPNRLMHCCREAFLISLGKTSLLAHSTSYPTLYITRVYIIREQVYIYTSSIN